jgi:hypothetical protein
MTSTEIQYEIISGIRDGLKALEGPMGAVSLVIENLTKILDGSFTEEPTTIDLRMGRRSPLLVEDAYTEAICDLFKWACKVLLDQRASRFGEFLGIAAKADTCSEIHHWVANSAINYLAFWPDGGWEFLRPYSGTDSVPKSDAEAEDLFIKIALPSVTAELMSLGLPKGSPWSDGDLERAVQHATLNERAIAVEIMSTVSLSPRMTRFYRALRVAEVAHLQRGTSSFIPV